MGLFAETNRTRYGKDSKSDTFGQIEQRVAVHPDVAECGNVGFPIERVTMRRAPIVSVASLGPCAYDLNELLSVFIRQRAEKHRTVLKIAAATPRPAANKTTTTAEKANELRICRRTQRASSRRPSNKPDAIILVGDIPSYR